ncbi:MAG: hypothetical protein WBL63_04435 [Candidatus Acidiferrum sp.]
MATTELVCETYGIDSPMKSNWKEILKDRLRLYGHRNWLVIADSAYPAHSRQGIETIVADEGQTIVLARVFAILRACKHIRPTICIDEELRFIAEKDAHGITSHREKLSRLLDGYGVYALPHEEIISRICRVSERFRVLSVKTNTRIPYTSVFFKLECGYWNADAEARLRASMPFTDRWANGYDDEGVPLPDSLYPDQGPEAFKESENWPKPAPARRRRR